LSNTLPLSCHVARLLCPKGNSRAKEMSVLRNKGFTLIELLVVIAII